VDDREGESKGEERQQIEERGKPDDPDRDNLARRRHDREDEEHSKCECERGDEGKPESRNPAKRLAVDDLVPVDRMREEGFEGPALLLL